jgi:hypothetical protein
MADVSKSYVGMFAIAAPLASPIQRSRYQKRGRDRQSHWSWGVYEFKMIPAEPAVNSACWCSFGADELQLRKMVGVSRRTR